MLKVNFRCFLGLPRCKNLTRFSLFASFCFAVRYCFKCFCFLCFTSSVSFTGSYTEVKPVFYSAANYTRCCRNYIRPQLEFLKRSKFRSATVRCTGCVPALLRPVITIDFKDLDLESKTISLQLSTSVSVRVILI